MQLLRTFKAVSVRARAPEQSSEVSAGHEAAMRSSAPRRWTRWCHCDLFPACLVSTCSALACKANPLQSVQGQDQGPGHGTKRGRPRQECTATHWSRARHALEGSNKFHTPSEWATFNAQRASDHVQPTATKPSGEGMPMTR